MHVVPHMQIRQDNKTTPIYLKHNFWTIVLLSLSICFSRPSTVHPIFLFGIAHSADYFLKGAPLGRTPPLEGARSGPANWPLNPTCIIYNIRNFRFFSREDDNTFNCMLQEKIALGCSAIPELDHSLLEGSSVYDNRSILSDHHINNQHIKILKIFYKFKKLKAIII
jgi:hypothetical protein